MFKIHNPLFYEEYVIKHHIMRFLGGEIIHRDEPFWFYIPVFLVGFVPYTFGFIALLIEKLKDLKYKMFDSLSPKEGFIALNIICALTIFLFFSSSKTKLVTYIVPIFPFVSVVIANWWFEYIEDNKHKAYVEISSIVFPRKFATHSATSATNAGSFIFPLLGTGAKYGESVSIKNLSSGTYFAISLNSSDFLKVTTPENEM